ncbi:hypothetical protein ABIF50_001338 [Bradyrhizobium diazoefficiens]
MRKDKQDDAEGFDQAHRETQACLVQWAMMARNEGYKETAALAA